MNLLYDPQAPTGIRPLVKIFKKLGYEKVSQKGSHIKVKNYTTGSVVIIPDHKENVWG
ncbi:MAG: type II toxin-antitoxin system HicA family toxin [Desulfobacteraceae bacterium]|nr:type II toxin-antitoxin system HicA family toxin [Desulfobacteraceae bacterium]